MTALVADHTYVDGRFVSDVAVVIEDGRIADIVAASSVENPERLPGRALLPAFVNAHSHAFQRVLRGRTEHRDPGVEGDDFWSWRERMYLAANQLDKDAIVDASRWTFIEMVKAGMGTLVEFHYVHHDASGEPYADALELDRAVAEAAMQVGLRLTMLRVAYARAGAGRKPEPRQLRFVDPDVETCLSRTIALQDELTYPLCRVGIAPHSIRAVPMDWLEAIADKSKERDWTVHVHASEQPAEIEAAQAEHGCSPIGILDRAGLLGPNTTLVHAVHVDEADVEMTADRKANVCACPTTEANLGDGIVPADRFMAAGVPVALGSDSHTVIDGFADARALENHLRLLRLQRNVLTELDWQGRHATAPRMFRSATVDGARAAGWSDLGVLRAGAHADLCAVDLTDPILCGVDADALLGALMHAGTARCVTDTWVAGRPVVRNGRHPGEEDARRRFEHLQRGLW